MIISTISSSLKDHTVEAYLSFAVAPHQTIIVSVQATFLTDEECEEKEVSVFAEFAVPSTFLKGIENPRIHPVMVQPKEIELRGLEQCTNDTTFGVVPDPAGLPLEGTVGLSFPFCCPVTEADKAREEEEWGEPLEDSPLVIYVEKRELKIVFDNLQEILETGVGICEILCPSCQAHRHRE